MRLTLVHVRKMIIAYGAPAMIAVTLHGAVAAGVWSLGREDAQAPRLLNSFEVVELASSGAVLAPPPAEPEPAPEPVAEPQPEPKPERSPEPKPEPTPAQLPLTPPLPQTMQKPKPVVKPQSAVPKAPPQATPETAPKPSRPAFVQSAEADAPAPAFVAPSQHAAYLNNPKPAYPTMARKRGMEGRVVLRVKVGTDGRVQSAEVEDSTGYSLLDRAARTAVLRWRFAPALRGLTPVVGEVLVPFDFRLTAEP